MAKRKSKARSGELGRVGAGLDLGARAVEILNLCDPRSTTVVATRDMRVLQDLGALLRAFAPDLGIALFPEWDCLPFDRVSPSLGVMGERAGTLRWLASEGFRPAIVLATIPTLCQRVPPPEIWAEAHVELRPGDPFDPDGIAAQLERLGYVQEERVEEAGQFAVHGQTVDVFPAAAPRPCRIEHEEGQVIEIRSYDVDTQRSLIAAESLIIDPATEIIVGDAEERPRPFAGEEHRLARYHDRLVTVLDYLPDARMLLDPEADARAELFFEQVEEGRGIAGREDDGLYLAREEWAELVSARSLRGAPPAPEIARIPVFARERRPTASFTRFLDERRQAGDKILLTGEGAGLRRLVREAVKASGPSVREVAGWEEAAKGAAGEVLSLSSPLRAGFSVPSRKITAVAAADLLGPRAVPASNRPAALSAGEIELQVGDVAVDREHGLCVFEGLQAVSETDPLGSEALRLRFAGDDVLMVPVEQADRIWRYGSEPEAVTLDKLQGGSWEARRQEVEAGIAQTARAMVAIAKRRASARVDPVQPDLRAMERFASGFRFNATPDQAAAIDDVLADLASDRPMDRLVCGDVGFGKTEIALRAAASAIFAGRQAALVAPTTVLVRQHAETLRRRFSRFGIEVGQLSRLVPPAEARRVKAGLADGTIKMVVGTQALAGKGVTFADLAVTVIDEEQRFGAKMKAKLRTLGRAQEGKAEPGHVLTLTATPIPRTLQGALSGLQSLTLLTTPPVARQPIRTLIAAFDPKSVGEALLRERARGGQSFVVCPRIEDLEPIAAKLAATIPDLTVTIAHGRLKPAEMDDRIVRFADGEGDVLLATSIIESGLDLPRANTMIVYRADRFGLAELHQLRGRVGRGQRRGVVHLTTDPDEPLSPMAEKRLRTMEKLDRLGAGFAIAARDLDLRGAGDLVGEEQAGHVRRIGLGLYQHLLELALAAAKGKPAEDWSPEVAVGPSGRIPHDFVPDPDTRLALYTRLFRARTGEEIEAWRDEVSDRFGAVPDEVERLVRTARLRAACRRLGVARLIGGPGGMAADMRQGRGGSRHVAPNLGSDDPDKLPALAERFLVQLGRSAAAGSGARSKRGRPASSRAMPSPRTAGPGAQRIPTVDGSAKLAEI
jgi:transcription-repair coupling factor (superfamily II helicase)